MDKTSESGQSITLHDARPEPKRWTAFTILGAFAPRAIMLVFGVILILWINRAEGGIGTTSTNLFGYHALLMAMFTVVFTQEAILAYSAPLWGPFVPDAKVIKAFHGFLHFLGLICCICGLVAIAKFKNDQGSPAAYPNYTLYSAHSWVGVAALSLWALQFIGGLFTYLFAEVELKRKVSKYHKFLGSVVYAAFLATCAMGLEDMQQSDLATSTPPANVTADQAMASTMAGMNMANMGPITGYLPNSNLSYYATSGSVLLLVCGLFTFLTKV
ncbi:eukaryotic cytochrome b561-domain-containing protein [Blyttiomyces helicus]|uniref:Eukaryotic cytochrome b561-domain-containing protein n=1 Tax=Blyttiomyces helicus TaxID=388810 RepID=A0A4P9W9A9_9FUNG|nr:eukaryotic cytochrome b561-domain-containing protein [Blyttiomyces helicus]|eukprot:RKO88984.1 eukaryotic cytochrome b561-domain-containing protein [Blyttiomyces helicus]